MKVNSGRVPKLEFGEVEDLSQQVAYIRDLFIATHISLIAARETEALLSRYGT
jgi:hypothetical protein